MKRLTRRGFTAAGILAAISAGFASLTGCDLDLVSCSAESLYGPPPDYDPSGNEVVDVYGPPDVDPSEWDEDVDSEENTDEDDGYDVEENVPVVVYGPPAG